MQASCDLSSSHSTNSNISNAYADLLIIAGFLLVTHAQAFAVASVQNITWAGNADLSFVFDATLLTGGVTSSSSSSVSAALNATSLVWRSVLASNRASATTNASAALGAMVGIALCALLCVIMPIIQRVAASRDATLTPFIEMPPQLIARLGPARRGTSRDAEEQAGEKRTMIWLTMTQTNKTSSGARLRQTDVAGFSDGMGEVESEDDGGGRDEAEEAEGGPEEEGQMTRSLTLFHGRWRCGLVWLCHRSPGGRWAQPLCSGQLVTTGCRNSARRLKKPSGQHGF